MPRVPVKLVSWDEIVEWSLGLGKVIESSGWIPDMVVAVARGGYVPARLLCDYLGVTDLMSLQSQHWVEAAKAAQKAIIRNAYSIEARGLKVLVVDDIVDTGETLALARDFIRAEWKPEDVRTAALQWISPIAKFKPDYYYIEVKDWTWFQYPWTRLEDLTQFIERIFREDERARGGLSEEDLRRVFTEWYGVRPEDFGSYWRLALDRLTSKGILEVVEGRLRLARRPKAQG
ncbi:MAG: phosphoribosyltransferase [Acidilobus sp.]|nr:phosphoribosyltransferase [Acidilobus sp.]MCG2889560.1 phosphoribosyltransferase [Acidilobus sp.]MCG2891604.1 phosphoribosyltransferase [Acidilobus sp.]